ncbi:MAG: Flp pilus assembly complex ATPase component TadA [Thermoleophilia bacterium]|nr:Flp pilus assembly complex ATPase component TadA [Thermoleophilia bacterium]
MSCARVWGVEKANASSVQAAKEGNLQRKLSGKRTGEVLVEMGVLTQEQVEIAIAEQRETHERIGDIALSKGWVTKAKLMEALGTRLGVKYLDLATSRVDPVTADLVSEKDARRYGAIPVSFIDDHTLLVAMADPSNIVAIDDLRILTGYDIEPAIATADDINTMLGNMRRADDEIAEDLDSRSTSEDETTSVELRDIREQVDAAPVVKLVNGVMSRAADEGASDIHFEPQAKDLLIRFRHDGVLHEIMTIPKRLQAGVISRLKIMADLDIAERRIPQDGRIGLVVGGRPIDMRVASLPTVYGEKVVIRLLDRSNVMLRLEDLGFSEVALARYTRSFIKPYGAVLVTGPTGSGKSTTLYATLNILNTPEKNIITVEDPVEYRLAGINQVQVNNKAGLTFAKGLRSILRCDPDIVMIGEIRDKETAQIAVESALTGHLVLSTLHTNNAPGALSRLTEMGVEPFLTASAVDCVIAQRLVRKLCEYCKEPYQATREMLERLDFPEKVVDDWKNISLHRAVGCSRCSNTGYKGRVGIYEIMPVTEAIERLIVERKSADEIMRVAGAEGMVTLRQDGLERAVQGLTSIEEISRVIV